ncbi:glycosyltransferase family 2 protein [Geminocystis sp. NIES-3708]|uniref:glycosyltransferase family 2 protein n=1 Tax=Geminocystis sp. NIES-3708 TaxID=1615909 RepID=UPI00082A6BA3|nr:glycosyltransferase family 2 protein [Geminocystis sp. NIES-3708]
MDSLELSIIMPCLNEAETLATCIEKAQWYLQEYQLKGEVLIADNGSDDGSQEIAMKMGATLVNVREKGYGSAIMGGILGAKGEFIIMADADDSYDFTNLNPFVEKLRSGYDLVMGNRFKGGIKPDAMPFLHKYLGNPVLTWLGKLFFRSPCNDFHCGLRGFRKQAILGLNLRTTGMEFASEMVVKSTLNGLKITEVPTTLSPDGRSRKPHLRTWRDGWRHLRFLLLYSPRWLFLYPGFFLMVMGLISTIILLSSPRVHSLLYSATAIIIGFQLVNFAIFTKVYGIQEGLLPQDKKFLKFLDFFTLEQGLIFGTILFILGGITSIFALFQWESVGFGSLNPILTMRLVIPSVTAIALGLQVIFASFFLSIFQLKTK